MFHNKPSVSVSSLYRLSIQPICAIPLRHVSCSQDSLLSHPRQDPLISRRMLDFQGSVAALRPFLPAARPVLIAADSLCCR